MPTEKINQIVEAKRRIEGGLNQLKSQLYDFRDKQDENGMMRVGQQIRALQSEYKKQQEAEYGERLVRKQELLDSLASYEGAGFVKTTVGGYSPMGGVSVPKRETYKSSKEGRKQLQAKLAELLDVDTSQIDVEKGLSYDQMAAAEVMQSPEGKEAVLAKFADGTAARKIIPIQIAGQENYLLDTGGGYKLAYTDLTEGRKIAASMQAGAFPVAASILGTMVGQKAIPGGKMGMVSQSVGGSTFYEGAAFAQEAIMGELYGAPYSAKQAGTQGAISTGIGLAIDTAMMLPAKIGAKLFVPKLKNQVDQALTEAVELVNKKNKSVVGKDAKTIRQPVGSTAGEKGLVVARELAGAYPHSRLTREVFDPAIEQLELFQKALNGEKVPNHKVREAVANRVVKQQERIAQVVSGRNRQLGAKLKRVFEDRRAALAPKSMQPTAKLGENLQLAVEQAKERGQKLKAEAFEGFHSAAESAGVRFGKSDVLQAVEETLKDDANALFESAGVRDVMARLAGHGGDDIGTREMRHIIEAVRDSVGTREVGGKTAEKVARSVEKRLQGMFKAKLSGTPLDEAWEAAVKSYDTNALAFQRSSPGAILSERYGDFAKSPTQAVKAVLGDERAVRDVLGAIEATGDGIAAGEMRIQMQQAYLDKIGLTNTHGKALKTVDEGVVRALWGDSAGDRLLQNLNDLNSALKISKVNPKNLTIDEIQAMSGVLSENERKSMLGTVIKRQRALDAEEKLVNNQIVNQFLKKGQWDVVDGDTMAKALLDGTPSDIQQAWRKIPLGSKKEVQQDFLANFFGKYASDGKFQTPTGYDLWDGEAVIRDLDGWTRGKRGKPQWVSNMDTVMGQDFTDLIIANSRINRAIRPIPKDEALKARGLVSGSGAKFYAGGVFESVKNRFFASAWGSNRLEPFLRRRAAGSQELDRYFQRIMNGMVGTRLGLAAAYHQSRNDPDFAEAMNDVFAEIARQESEE